MTQLHATWEGDALQKVGSIGLMAAAVLFAIGGLLMPHAAGPTNDLREMLQPLGMYPSRTVLASLFTALGFWLALAGVAGVHESITASSNAGNGAAWARLGLYFTVAGTVLWTVSLALDVSAASAVASWLQAPTDAKDATWSVVAAISAFGRGMVPITWVFYWLALAVVSFAMIQSGIYPLWLGWTGLFISLPTIALGTVQTLNPRSIALTLVFAVLMLLTSLWMLALGIWMARRAW
jgi:hypothetical protein